MSKLSICFFKWFWYFHQYIVGEQPVWPEKMRSTVPILVLGCSHYCQIIDSVFSFQFGWLYFSFRDDIKGCFPFLFSFLLLKLSCHHLFKEKDGGLCLAKACEVWIFKIESIPDDDNCSKDHMCNILSSAVRFCIIQRALFPQGSYLR